ncbi:4465_t:CDS:2 [Paraglomus occultum]|uniref:4465_t:CDS:1 n=1 Tax=Paraglomus occultum TaxID=144539 RepID=A0A9N9GDJ7_9GLOM|nr:4465_t:CDS:2 [Paraglomus occultum]
MPSMPDCYTLHNGAWQESDDKLRIISRNVLEVIKSVWRDPAFKNETVSESMYLSRIIGPAILTLLSDNPFGEDLTYFSSERQSIARADRRNRKCQTGRRPDLMLVAKDDDRTYELLYLECSKPACTRQKENDDKTKLWRHMNDGLYWVYKTRRPEKGHFGVIGVQVAGTKLILKIMIRDRPEVHCLFRLQETVQFATVEVLADFMKVLLTIRNILIINVQLLYNARIRRSQRNEDSTTVTSE